MHRITGRFIAFAAFVLAASPIAAQHAPDSARATIRSNAQRRFCWRGRPQSACRAFGLFELTANSFYRGSKLDPSVTRPGFGSSRADDALASHTEVELGAMLNVRANAAVGGTLIGGGISEGSPPTQLGGIAARYRRWWSPALSSDVALGAMQMPVGVAVGPANHMQLRHVRRTALFTDLRLGYADLISVSTRLMIAGDGQGHTRSALFLGASTGSWVTTTIAGAFAVWVVALSPRGDKVTVQ